MPEPAAWFFDSVTLSNFALAVPVTGTLGILLAAVRDMQLAWADADALLRKMIAAGFHSPMKGLPRP